jgi:membrane protease YdiL (CAAX protease family)
MNNPPTSKFSVNLLYLASILLVLSLGSTMQSLHLAWGLIATEAFLVLLPAIAFLRMHRIPLKEGLRLKPIRPLTGLLCVGLGFTTFLFSIIIDAIMAQLTGMPSVPLPTESLPRGMLEMIGLFFGMAIFAPLCEEALYRGAIQGVYEQQHPARVAISVTALLFAFSHFRLSGLPGLLPVAFILGFVAWRTRSIYASILVHFGLNVPSAIHSIRAMSNGTGLPFIGLPAAGVGFVATGVLVYFIWRLQPVEKRIIEQEKVKRRVWLWNYWPLLGAGSLYLWFAWSTLAATFGTGLITLKQAGYNHVVLNQVYYSQFQISNQAGEEVGEMICTIAPQDSMIHLDCSSTVRAYEIQIKTGYFKDGEHSADWSATWDPNTMDLVEFNYARIYTNPESNLLATYQNNQLAVESSTETQVVSFSPDTLLEYEWAWRTNALKPQIITSIQAPFCYLYPWNEQVGRPRPTLKTEVLHLYGSQPLTLPTGQFMAQKSTLGGQMAWYTKDHTGPVRLEDGMLIYELTK